MATFSIEIPQAAIKHPIEAGGSITIGRAGSASADIQLEDPDFLISRMHLMIENRGGEVIVKDLDSSNGVFINKRRIASNEPIALRAGDRLKIGNFDVHILSEASTAADAGGAPRGPNEADRDSIQMGQYFLSLIARKGKIRIGRSPDNDVVTDPNDRTVGRWHAELWSDNGRWFIKDLNSKNGVFVNQRRIKEPVEISGKDWIYVCLHAFNIEQGYKDLREEVAIEATQIEKTFPNGYVGLKKMDFKISFSKFVAVMGPSGCGKSTLLKVLNGDNPATSGKVLIHGLDLVDNYGLLKKKIGYVPQDDIIHKELTVRQTMWFSSKLRLEEDISKQVIQEKIDGVLQSLFDKEKIPKIIDKPVKSLSGGERKRLSIAVELLTDPTILFLDEPTSPLDPETIHEFLTKLNNLKARGTTIIMVTHKPEDLNYVDQVVFLGTGGMHVYQGKQDEILSYFEKDSITKVYGLLSETKTAERFYHKIYQEGGSQTPFKQSRMPGVDKETSVLSQLKWLTLRYFQVKVNDKANISLLIAQPVIIGLLITVIFKDFQLGVIFLMAISAIWFGVSNAAKEIVSEQSIYKRERMFNLKINTYLWSKINVLATISIIQLLVFESIIYFKFRWLAPEGFEDIYQQSFIGSLAFMFFLSISSTLLGLLLSTKFDNAEKVMTVVPIALMPQIMLAGVITKIDNWGMELLSFLTFGRWGTEGLSRIQDNAVDDGTVPSDSLQSVIAYTPRMEKDTIVVSEACQVPIEKPNMDKMEATAKGAMELLDFYNQKLTDDGELIGGFMDSMLANNLAILTINVILYVLIFYFLKKKDSI